MIVLVIIGIMAMTVAPSLTEVVTNNRQSSAAMELVKFGRRVRSRAISSGTAQLAVYRAAGSNNHGRIDVYAGANNKCLQTPWAEAMDPDKPGHGPIRAQSYDMFDYNPGTNPLASDPKRQVIRLIGNAPDVLSELWLCYQPDGMVYAAYRAGEQLRIQDIEVRFTIARTINGVAHGADRIVVFPTGGNARLQ